MPSRESVVFGPFLFDLASGQLHREGRRLSLQTQPARVLAHLVAHCGEVVSRDELRRAIWGDSWVNFDQGLNYCIRQIRIALEDDPRTPLYLQTLPQRGYRFIGAVDLAAGPKRRNASPLYRKAAFVSALVVAGMLAGVQLTSIVLHDVMPEPQKSLIAEHLQPLHLLRGAWTHHLKPLIAP